MRKKCDCGRGEVIPGKGCCQECCDENALEYQALKAGVYHEPAQGSHKQEPIKPPVYHLSSTMGQGGTQ